MPTKTLTMTAVAERNFPTAEVKRRLREELRQAAEESAILRAGWEPLLDSLRMVSVVLTLEELFPSSFKLPPEKLVRRGGYTSVDEGVEDMCDRLQRLWNERSKPGVRS